MGRMFFKSVKFKTDGRKLRGQEGKPVNLPSPDGEGRDGVIFAENNEILQKPQNDNALSPNSPIALLPLNNKKLDCFAYARNDKSCATHTDKDLFAYSPIRLFTFKKAAFTLAEVMIVVTIIGVVAALVMPPFVRNTAERINSHRQANIAQKITKSVELMVVNGDYQEISNTEQFVNKLSKYLKIAKICDSEHLTECWPTKKIKTTKGEYYNVEDAKTAADLHVGRNNDTPNVGLVLADGASLIMTFNPKASPVSAEEGFSSSSKELPVGNKKTQNFAYTSNATDAIDFIMDVNGKTGPNQEPDSSKDEYYDIRSFRKASFDNCAGTNVAGVGCVVLANNRRWSAIVNYCKSLDMDVPSFSDIQSIYNERNNYSGIPKSGRYFSKTESGIEFQTGNVIGCQFAQPYPIDSFCVEY